MPVLRVLAITVFWGCLALPGRTADPAPRLEFTRMIAHLGGTYRDEGYLDFIDAANPELVQLGFYGAHFWGLVHTPQYKGYPASFPVQGIEDCVFAVRAAAMIGAAQQRAADVVSQCDP